MFDANNFSARSYVPSYIQVNFNWMLVDWIQNYINTIQALDTLENRNVIRYNLGIFRTLFQAKIRKN